MVYTILVSILFASPCSSPVEIVRSAYESCQRSLDTYGARLTKDIAVSSRGYDDCDNTSYKNDPGNDYVVALVGVFHSFIESSLEQAVVDGLVTASASIEKADEDRLAAARKEALGKCVAADTVVDNYLAGPPSRVISAKHRVVVAKEVSLLVHESRVKDCQRELQISRRSLSDRLATVMRWLGDAAIPSAIATDDADDPMEFVVSELATIHGCEHYVRERARRE